MSVATFAFAAAATSLLCFTACRYASARGVNVALTPAHGVILAVSCVFEALLFPLNGHGAAMILVCSACAVSAVTDLSCGYIFDAVSLTVLCCVFVFSIYTGSATDALAGCLAAAGVPLALYAITRGRGIGLGDVKLSGCIGAALGTHGWLAFTEFAYVAGGAHAAALLVTRKSTVNRTLPFAPHLAASLFACTSLGYGR